MKMHEKNNTYNRTAGSGRRALALLLALVMVVASLPLGRGGYTAFAEGEAAVTTAQTETAETAAAVTEPTAAAPAVSDTAVASPADVQPVSGADAQTSVSDVPQHICVIHGFENYTPGVAYDEISVEKGSSLYQVKSKLPRELNAVLECEDCPKTIEVTWKNTGADRFDLVLDSQLYKFVPLDDPTTEDIDESKESPFCDLPFVSVKVTGGEPAVSGSDVASGADVVSGADIASGSDVISGSDMTSGSDVVSGSDVTSGSDVISGSDVTSGSDAVSGSDVISGSDATQQNKPAAGETSSDTDVASGSDAASDSDVPAVCSCEKHCYADVSGGSYSVDIHCPVCSADPSGCAVLPELTELTLKTVTADGRTVSVTGPLPEGAVLKAETVAEDQLSAILGGVDFIVTPVVRFAYDITIVYEGREFQPAEFGSSVKVVISDACADSSEGLAVFHVAEEGLERVAVGEEGSAAVFSTDSFSVYVGLSAGISTIYVSGNSFFTDSAMNNQLAKDGVPYTGISSVLADSTGDITFVVLSAYNVTGTETVNPGSGRSITLERASGNTGNIIAVASGGNLTLSGSIAVDGKNVAADGANVDIADGGTLIMNDGVSVVNGEAVGVLNRYGASFTMNGGLIANNKGVNGAGIYNVGTMVMKGGTISGNVSRDNGGGIWQEGTFTMVGGTITGNNCGTMFGGALFAYGGTAGISGGTITGNTSSTYPQANGVSTYNGSAATVIFSGSPRIEDSVYVNTSGTFNNILHIADPFTPLCPVIIQGSSDSMNLVQYTRNATAADLANFVPRNTGTKLVLSGNYIQGSGNSNFFFYGDGSGNSKTPETWRLSIPYVYQNGGLRTTGGTVFMAHGFFVGTEWRNNYPGVTLSENQFRVQSNSPNSLSSGNRVLYRRWERPAAMDGNSKVHPTNSHSPMFAAAEKGYLRIQNLIIDGGNQPGVLVYNNQTYQLNGIKSCSDASLTVRDTATLDLQGSVVLRNAPHSSRGGAIHASSGTLNLNGTITFSNNGSAATLGKAVYVESATVNINTPNIVNPGNEDFYLANSTSKLTINTNLTGVIPITVNPNDTASCAPGRVVATYASGYTPDASKFRLANVDYPLVVSGQNIVIGSYSKRFTAHAEDITPDAGESNSFVIDLASLYGGMGNVTGKTVSVSNVALTSGSIVIGDYQVVEANRRVYGCADSNKYFGVSVQLDGTVQDLRSVSMTAGSDGKMVFTVHNGNAITVDGDIATFSFQLNVGGSVRYINVTLNAHSGYTISASVPLRITGVVDTNGKFYLPDGTDYAISNNGTVPLVLSDVEWDWIIDGGHDANELFTQHENITMSLNIGGLSSRSFGETQGYQWLDVNSPIPAHDGTNPGRLSLDWSMDIGSANYIRTKQGATVANITYTIEIKE